MGKSRYAVALAGLVASQVTYAGTAVPLGVSLGAVLGSVLGTSLAQATGLPTEVIGSGAVLAVAAIALTVGIRIVRRKQGR